MSPPGPFRPFVARTVTSEIWGDNGLVANVAETTLMTQQRRAGCRPLWVCMIVTVPQWRPLCSRDLPAANAILSLCRGEKVFNLVGPFAAPLTPASVAERCFALSCYRCLARTSCAARTHGFRQGVAGQR